MIPTRGTFDDATKTRMLVVGNNNFIVCTHDAISYS